MLNDTVTQSLFSILEMSTKELFFLIILTIAETTTRSKWLIVIQLDWRSYRESLKLITIGIKGVQDTLKEQFTKLKPDKNEHICNMLSFKTMEVNNFETSRNIPLNTINEIRTMHKTRDYLYRA